MSYWEGISSIAGQVQNTNEPLEFGFSWIWNNGPKLSTVRAWVSTDLMFSNGSKTFRTSIHSPFSTSDLDLDIHSAHKKNLSVLAKWNLKLFYMDMNYYSLHHKRIVRFQEVRNVDVLKVRDWASSVETSEKLGVSLSKSK